MQTATQTSNDTTGILIGKDQASLDKEDAFLARLSNIAYVEETSSKYGSRKSRFWFRVESTEQFVKEKKKKLEKPTLEHIDEQVEKRTKTYEVELTPALKTKIELIREFFLTEIAPLTFASSAGGLQAKAVAERLLDTEIDASMFSRFDNMVNRAATIKMASFVLSYFNLPESHFNSLIGPRPSAQDPVSDSIKELMDMMSHMPNKKTLKQEIDSSLEKFKKELDKK